MPHGVQAAAPAERARSEGGGGGQRSAAARGRGWAVAFGHGFCLVACVGWSRSPSPCEEASAPHHQRSNRGHVAERGRYTHACTPCLRVSPSQPLSLFLFLIRLVTCFSLPRASIGSSPRASRIRLQITNGLLPCSNLRTMHLPNRPLACAALESRDPFSSRGRASPLRPSVCSMSGVT